MKNKKTLSTNPLGYIYPDTSAYKERLAFISEGSHLFNRPLKYTNERDLLFLPSSINKKLHCFEGGIFDKVNKPIVDAFQREGLNKIDILLESNLADIRRIDEPVVYLGQIRNHWGSFLVDSVSRLWYAKDDPKAYKYLYMITQPELGIKIHKNIMRFLELFGISESQIIFINEPSVVSNVIIPEMSYIPNVGYWKEFVDTIRQVVFNVKPSAQTYGKVYFSRYKFSKKSKTDFGELSLIKLIEKNGYKVFYPEELTLDEQISIMNSCNEFCSVGGSLAHNILFSIVHKPKMVLFNRLSDYQWHQWMINEMVGVDYMMIDSFVEPYKWFTKTTIRGPFLFSINRYVKKFISINGWKKGNDCVFHRLYVFMRYSFYFFKVWFHIKKKQKNK